MSQPPRWMSLFGADPAINQSIAKRDVDGRYLITHDMGVVAEIADRVLVMYRARRWKRVPSNRFFMHRNILHPCAVSCCSATWCDERVRLSRRFPLISLEHPAKQAPPIERKRWWMANLFYECVILSPVSFAQRFVESRNAGSACR